MRNNHDNNLGAETTTVRLRLPATVDNFYLASLLNPLFANQQYQVCLDASRVSRLGTVEFRMLGSFAERCRRHGGFLKLENVGVALSARVREFGVSDLLSDLPRSSPV